MKYMCEKNGVEEPLYKNEFSCFAPVVVFAYSRKDKVEVCLKNLERNKVGILKKTDLFIFADGYKSKSDKNDVLETQSFLESYSQHSLFKEVFLKKNVLNVGLANSIIEGVTEVVNQYGKVIVVEDDIMVSNTFLEYMNSALSFYESQKVIGQINAYSYPLKALKKYRKDVFFLKKGDCWGWATWSDRWNNAIWKDFDYLTYYHDRKKRIQFEKLESYWDRIMIKQMKGLIDSWAIRWVFYLFENNMLAVYPKNSLVSNYGMDGNGTHCERTDKFYVPIIDDISVSLETDVKVNRVLERQAARFPRNGTLTYYLARIRDFFLTI